MLRPEKQIRLPNNLQMPAAQYYADLDDALTQYMRGADFPLRTFLMKTGMVAKFPPAGSPARTVAIMKMVTARLTLPADIRAEAREWLDANGFQSWDPADLKQKADAAKQRRKDAT